MTSSDQGCTPELDPPGTVRKGNEGDAADADKGGELDALSRGSITLSLLMPPVEAVTPTPRTRSQTKGTRLEATIGMIAECSNASTTPSYKKRLTCKAQSLVTTSDALIRHSVATAVFE